MDASQARKKLLKVARERERYEEVLLRMRGAMVAGSLMWRTTRCKRRGCRCGQGEPHGPFLYLSRNEGGKTRWVYIGKASEGRLAQAARRYKEFSDAVRALHRLQKEADECYAAIEESLLESPETVKERRAR